MVIVPGGRERVRVKEKIGSGNQNNNKGATVWTLFTFDNTSSMIDLLGLRFFEVIIVVIMPGAPPKKIRPNPAAGRCVFDFAIVGPFLSDYCQ